MATHTHTHTPRFSNRNQWNYATQIDCDYDQKIELMSQIVSLLILTIEIAIDLESSYPNWMVLAFNHDTNKIECSKSAENIVSLSMAFSRIQVKKRDLIKTITLTFLTNISILTCDNIGWMMKYRIVLPNMQTPT